MVLCIPSYLSMYIHCESIVLCVYYVCVYLYHSCMSYKYLYYLCMSDIANLPLSRKAAKSHGYQDANECLKLLGGELRLFPVMISGFGVTIQILTLPL